MITISTATSFHRQAAPTYACIFLRKSSIRYCIAGKFGSLAVFNSDDAQWYLHAWCSQVAYLSQYCSSSEHSKLKQAPPIHMESILQQ